MWELPGLSIAALGTASTFGLTTARTAVAEILVRAGELVGPGREPVRVAGTPDSPPAPLDSAVRRKVGQSLAAEVNDMLEDAAKRGVSERGAEVLLLTADVVRWLRDGGELPGKGAIELVELHVALFNDARHEDEREAQQALLAVLLALVDAQAEVIRGGRWRHRRVNAEAAQERERRRFGANLDELRRKRGMTIGELAERAQLEVLAVVRFIFAAEEAGETEIRLLAGALDVEPGALFPDLPAGMVGGTGVAEAEDGPSKEQDR
jgi:hypothetical protein